MPKIFYSPELRAQWPSLSRSWLAQYPAVFDSDDLRQVLTQQTKHFIEWFTAVYIYQRFGLPSLVEKAQYRNSHPEKTPILNRLMTEDEFQRLCTICDECEVQWPDLLVYKPGTKQYWFVEAKGPTDHLSEKQIRSHKRIEKYLQRPVRVYNVAVGPPGRR